MQRSQCKWVMVNKPNVGKQCTRHPRNGDYCGEHKKLINRRITRPEHNLESMSVAVAEPVPKLPREPKTKSSVFQLTVNFQKSYTKMTDEERNARKDFVQRSLMDLDHVRGYLFNPDLSSGASAEHIIDPALILSVESEFYPEAGERLDKFHYHGLIKVIHRTKILFDKSRLIRDARDAGFGTIHVNIKGGRDEAGDYLAYARKKQQDFAPNIADVPDVADVAVVPEVIDVASEGKKIVQLAARKKRSTARPTMPAPTAAEYDHDLAYFDSLTKRH